MLIRFSTQLKTQPNRLESSGGASNAPVLAMPEEDPRTMAQLPGLAARLAGQAWVLLVLFGKPGTLNFEP